MNVIKTSIDGVLIIEPRIFEDARGYFFESFSQRELDKKCVLSLSCRTMNQNPARVTFII